MNNVRTYGYAVQHMMSEDGAPSFSYTVGLADKGLPELLIVGIPPETAHSLINKIADLLIGGVVPVKHDQVLTKVSNFPLRIRDMDATRAAGFATLAIHYADERSRDLWVMQVVFPDARGLFPGEPGCDARIEQLQAMMPRHIDADELEGEPGPVQTIH